MSKARIEYSAQTGGFRFREFMLAYACDSFTPANISLAGDCLSVGAGLFCKGVYAVLPFQVVTVACRWRPTPPIHSDVLLCIVHALCTPCRNAFRALLLPFLSCATSNLL